MVDRKAVLSKVKRGAIIGGIGDALEDRSKFIRDTFQKQYDYLSTQGAKRNAAVKEMRQKFSTAANWLKSNGMNEDLLAQFIADNPDGMANLYSKARDQKLKGNTVNGEILNAAVELASEYEPGTLSIQEAIETITPIFNSTTDPVERERKVVGSLMFPSASQAAGEQVQSAKILGDVTGRDIMASLGETTYKSGDSTSTVDYSGFTDYDASEIAAFRAEMRMEYEDAWNNVFSQLSSGDQVAATKWEREYQELSGDDKVAKMMTDPKIGPLIARKYYQMDSSIVKAPYYSMSAVEAVESFPSYSNKEIIDGTTFYLNDEGVPVYARNADGDMKDPDSLQEAWRRANSSAPSGPPSDTTLPLPSDTTVDETATYEPRPNIRSYKKMKGLHRRTRTLTPEQDAELDEMQIEWDNKYGRTHNNDGTPRRPRS